MSRSAIGKPFPKKLSFEDKRSIAKMLVAGQKRKAVCHYWNISHATLTAIYKKFVVVKLSEAYPDTDEPELPGL